MISEAVFGFSSLESLAHSKLKTVKAQYIFNFDFLAKSIDLAHEYNYQTKTLLSFYIMI